MHDNLINEAIEKNDYKTINDVFYELEEDDNRGNSQNIIMKMIIKAILTRNREGMAKYIWDHKLSRMIDDKDEMDLIFCSNCLVLNKPDLFVYFYGKIKSDNYKIYMLNHAKMYGKQDVYDEIIRDLSRMNNEKVLNKIRKFIEKIKLVFKLLSFCCDNQ